MTTIATKPRLSYSQITLWRDCPARWRYKYEEHLEPKSTERPLFIGTWVHACLEAYYKTGNWRDGHDENVKQYNRMFEPEKLRLDRGKSKKQSQDRADYEPLPMQVERIVRSYIWYYRNRHEETIGVEVPFTLDMGDWELFGVIDRIYKDLDTGLIIVEDHKVWDDLPDEGAYHTMDPQLTYYLRGAQEALGVQANAIEYNYVRSTPPSFPELTTKGKISESAISTDYPTLFRWLKDNGFDPRDYSERLVPLAKTSPFLKRYRLPRTDIVTERIFADAEQSAQEILHHQSTVRNISRQCSWCPYEGVCRGDLFGIDTTPIKLMKFMTAEERDALRKKRKR